VDWSIQEIAKIAGTTSRTLRHYDDIGLLKPSRTGQNGYRYYDSAALVQLQRILLLRGLGLGLPAIPEALRHETDGVRALGSHLEWLRQEQARLARQAASFSEQQGRCDAKT
jgi:DNA-binding transcriptional MerR regulator